MEKVTKTAIIIGAGPAGLTAAYKLLEKSDIHPIILEATNEIGGIAKTVTHNGNRMDIGGHRFFSKEPKVTSLWNEIMPLQGSPSIDDIILEKTKALNPGGPNPEKTEIAMLLRQRVSRIYYLRKFFDYPLSLKLETFTNLGFINTMKAGFGYLWSMVFKRKEKSLEDFMVNRFGVPLYKMFFEDYTQKVWGINPRFISPDWGAQRIKGLSLWKALKTIILKPFTKNSKKVETSLIEEFYYPKRGPGQLYERMAELIKEKGGEVRLLNKVTGIKMVGNRIKSITVTTPTGEESIQGDYYLSTMPIKDFYESLGEKKSPKEVYEVATKLVYRDFITVGLLVPKLKIQNKTKIKTLGNIVPDCWIYIQEREVKVGRLQIFNNWSPYMVKDPKNTVWVGLEYFVNEGDEMWKMDDASFIKLACEELAKIGVIDINDVLDSVRVNVVKAYPAYFGTYDRFDIVKAHLSTIENLYCLGRNGQHRYNNMDHSMMTAMVAVDSILDPSSTPKEDIWNVNTEKQYHETKKNPQ